MESILSLFQDNIIIISESIAFFSFFIFTFSVLRKKKPQLVEILSIVLLLNCIFFYVTYWKSVQQVPILFFAVFPIAVLLPYTYFLFCKFYFTDNRFSLKRLVLILGSLYLVNLASFLISFKVDYAKFSVLGYILSLLMIVLASIYTIKGHKIDLSDDRRLVRKVLVVINGVLGVAIVISFTTMHPLAIPRFLVFLALLSQIILSFVIFKVKIDFNFPKPVLLREQQIVGETQNDDLTRILGKVKSLMLVDKIYREEGLTITKLSHLLSEKEYLVRKAINVQLGYANFNQFLNYYRVSEAKEIMANSSEKSMKEIAFFLGYPNPSAFNRAFKNLVHFTPTEYKKSL